MSENDIEAKELLDRAYNNAVHARICEKPYAEALAFYYNGLRNMYTKLTGQRLAVFSGVHEPE